LCTFRQQGEPPDPKAVIAVIDLAISSAQALVNAMTTSAWNDGHAKVIAIFGKHKANKQLQDQLNVTYDTLRADPAQREREIARWARMLQVLIEADADAAVDVGLIREQLSQLSATHARVQQTGFAQRDQFNVAGNVTINHH
jgi:hypothetical protein